MTSEYTQDVAFNSDFGALQTPVHLTTAALVSGYPAGKVAGDFRYLDLACGNGHTLTILASAHPEAEFVGVDINPAHIDHGKALAELSELSNITFICSDIAHVSAQDLGTFNYCTVSGVFSWLDTKRQSILVDLVSEILAPQGLFYLDYCALPGIAPNATLYSMLQQLSGEYSGSSADKLVKASQLLNVIRDNNGQFFQQNLQANERFSRLLANPPEDEAHEVLNLQPNSVWSKDIIEAAERVGLNFVGSAGLHHNVAPFADHLGLPPESESFSVATRQMLQDIAWNIAQRKDIYTINNAVSSLPLLDRAGHFAFYFPPGALNEKVIRHITQQFPAAHLLTPELMAILSHCTQCDSIASMAHQFCDIYVQKTGSDFNQINELIEQLLATRIMSLAVMSLPSVTMQGSIYMPSKLNRTLLKQDIHLEHGRPFASPVVGTRVLLPIKDRLYLWALVFHDLGKAWDNMGELRDIFHDPNGNPITKETFISIIERSKNAFIAKVVPELVRLGILTYR